MRLTEFLEQSDGSFFYIGAVDGSGFFIMGEKSDIFDEVAYQNKQEEARIERKMRRYGGGLDVNANEMARIYKRRIETIDLEIKELRRELLTTRSTERKKAIHKMINSRVYRKKYNQNRYSVACQKADACRKGAIHTRKVAISRVPFADREVVKTYRSIQQQPAGVIVIVDGKESGKYWCFDEYLKGEKR